MQAVLIRETGTPEVLHHEQADRPSARALDRGHGVIRAVTQGVRVDHEQRRHAGDRSRVSRVSPFSGFSPLM